MKLLKKIYKIFYPYEGVLLGILLGMVLSNLLGGWDLTESVAGFLITTIFFQLIALSNYLWLLAVNRQRNKPIPRAVATKIPDIKEYNDEQAD